MNRIISFFRNFKRQKMKVVPNDTGWELCTAAEERMQRSIRDNAVVLVNDTVLVKLRGKLTGIAVQNDPNGEEIRDSNWYSPRDNQTRRRIRRAADRGETRVEIGDSSWIHMRGVQSQVDPHTLTEISREALLEDVHKTATSLPSKAKKTREGKSPKEYRKDVEESLGKGDTLRKR